VKWSDSTYGFFLEGATTAKRNYKPEEIVWKLAGERAHRERNQDSRCRVRTLGVTQVTVLPLAYLLRDAQIVVESWRGQTSGEQSTLSIDPG